MPSSNIDRFDEITAKTLAQLYEEFPVPKTLNVSQYGVDIEGERWDDPIALGDAEFVIASLIWLGETGYIRYSGVLPPRAIGDAVLTAKGLEVLKAIPDSLNGKKTIGEQLVAAAKSGATEALKDGVKAALAKGAVMLGAALS